MMTPEALADLHRRCFTTHPRPWSEAELVDLLESPHNFLIEVPHGFLMGRSVVDEAELITLAVAPEARRQGIARDLLAQFCATARARGAVQAFLEVALDNAPAQALYAREGWETAGRRRNYYATGVDAILMRRPL